MQKIIRRTEKASRTVARKKAKEEAHKRKGHSWEQNQTRVRILKDHNQSLRQARIDRRVDWETGPLAPRRDVGEKAKTYGAMPIDSTQIPEKDPEERMDWWHIASGDRVVITRGHDQGKIGVVSNRDRKRNTVTIKDLNKLDITIPEWMKEQQGDHRDVFPHDQPISVEHVKLVYPLPDPVTGAPRDVIIDRLQNIRGKRAIPGTNTIIPWPERRDRDSGAASNDGDTLRILVEEQTFRPYLIRPPMPLSVIDELRNKYSKFRTRHDHEYVAAKELEDVKDEDRKKLIKTMRTPLQELADFKAAQKEQEKKELSEEQLAVIGAVIAQEQARDGIAQVQ